jgi:hypothetical protein
MIKTEYFESSILEKIFECGRITKHYQVEFKHGGQQISGGQGV